MLCCSGLGMCVLWRSPHGNDQSQHTQDQQQVCHIGNPGPDMACGIAGPVKPKREFDAGQRMDKVSNAGKPQAVIDIAQPTSENQSYRALNEPVTLVGPSAKSNEAKHNGKYGERDEHPSLATPQPKNSPFVEDELELKQFGQNDDGLVQGENGCQVSTLSGQLDDLRSID